MNLATPLADSAIAGHQIVFFLMVLVSVGAKPWFLPWFVVDEFIFFFCKNRRRKWPPLCLAEKMLRRIFKRTLFTIVFFGLFGICFLCLHTTHLVEKMMKNIGGVEKWARKLPFDSCFWLRTFVLCSFLVANIGFVETKRCFLQFFPEFDTQGSQKIVQFAEIMKRKIRICTKNNVSREYCSNIFFNLWGFLCFVCRAEICANICMFGW